jgi:hypothetical protein
VQNLKRFVAVAGNEARHHRDCFVDAATDENVFVVGRAAKHPAGDAIFVSRMADAHTETMELAVAQQAHDVAQAVLAAVAAVNLQSILACGQIEFVVRDLHFGRIDFPNLLRSEHGFTAEIHKRSRLQ